MESNNQNEEEWYMLESMKATNHNTTNQVSNGASVSNQERGEAGWYSLEGLTSAAAKELSAQSLDDKSHRMRVSDSSSVDFHITDTERDENAGRTHSSFQNKGTGSPRSLPSPGNLRLHLQESIDGEISNTSSKDSSLSDSNQASGNVDTTSNTNATLNDNKSVFSSMNLDDSATNNDKWVNLTGTSNMQDVDRPEPLGRPELSNTPLSQTLSASSTKAGPEQDSQGQTKFVTSNKSSSSLNQTKSSKGTESDIPELSYTESNVGNLQDSQYLNKRVGPAQDVKLQSSSNDALSSMTSSSSDFSARLSASKLSNETPVTKLLGPAYKQTEKFLKDLQVAKLSYANKENTLGLSKMESSFDSRKSNISTSSSSKDESVQVGKSKLNVSSTMNSTGYSSSAVDYNGDLTEQDIASASLLASEASRESDPSAVKEGSNDEQSEGELLMSELSETLNNKEKSDRRSRSSISRTSSSRPVSSLEPIKEIKSPDKARFPVKDRKNEDLSREDNQSSFNVDHPISATSTPYVDNSGNRSSLINGSFAPSVHYDKINVEAEDTSAQSSSNFLQNIPNGSGETTRTSLDAFRIKQSNQMVGQSDVERPRVIYAQPIRSVNKYVLETELVDKQRTKSNQSRHKKINLASTGHSSDFPVHSKYQSNHYLPGPRQSNKLDRENILHQEGFQKGHSPRKIENKQNESSTLTSSSSSEERPVPRLSIDENSNPLDSTTATESRRSSDSPSSMPKRSYVFPKQINITSSDRSSPKSPKAEKEKRRSSARKDKREGSFRKTSLNELWDSFEKSYRDASGAESPLLKKLEIVSNLLQESRQRSSKRRQIMNLSDSDSNTTSYCESHRSFQFNDGENIVGTRVPTSNRNAQRSTANVCPLCRRREVGTNFPTPSVSDVEKDTKARESPPLTLQTWTQTSPYIIDNGCLPRYLYDLKRGSRENTKSASKEQTPVDNNRRKNSYTIVSPSKLNRPKSHDSTSTRKKDVPYTAWFQSVLSDNSDVIPLGKVPSLSSLYLDNHEKKIKNTDKTRIPNADLQDAFKRHKYHFIERSKARVQEIKDGVLREKHGDQLQKDQRIQHGTIATEKRRVSLAITEQNNGKLTYRKGSERQNKSRTPSTHRSLVDSPRNYQYLEGLRMDSLRQNRLKMKQYDLKNRERFLKRRAKATIKRRQCVVVRH